jgi:TM2 domain-containing membrane protein YozV
VLSTLVTGAGHLYAGQFGAAVMWFVAVWLGYALILPGLILHLFSIASAAVAARRVETRTRLALAAAP